MNTAASGHEPLGKILVDQGSLSEEQLKEALQIQGGDKRKIGQILLSRGYVKRHHIDIALAKQKKMG